MKNLSYSLGMSMATQLMQTGLENLDVEAFVKAFTEIMKNEDTTMSLEEASNTFKHTLVQNKTKC